MIAFIVATAAIFLFILDRAISYYGAMLGLLYYLGMKHDDLLSVEKVKELRNAALIRRIEELFGKR